MQAINRKFSAAAVTFAAVVLGLCGVVFQSANDAGQEGLVLGTRPGGGREAAGREVAARARAALRARWLRAEAWRATAPERLRLERLASKIETGHCLNDPECGETDVDPDVSVPAAGGQNELAIAMDPTGQHVVVGFNDTQGFSTNPLRVSGYMYSSDGGHTFTYGGLLPVTVTTSVIGATLYPQVFGDPDVTFVRDGTTGACRGVFVYSSLIARTVSFTATPGTAQTLGLHRSFDCGVTWEGPFEVTAATNPNGLVLGASARDAADKPFIDVDPDTGRIIATWSNFTSTGIAPAGVEIRTAYSDNVLTATPPVWSEGTVVAATITDGQASVARFAGHGSPNAYIAWRRFSGLNNLVGFSRSVDNGQTWSSPIDLSAAFFTVDEILGNDRKNTSPAMAVDLSDGPHSGTIYVVYQQNDLRDGGDIAVQRSNDEGLTFSAPVRVNSRPGNDRAQWFPAVTVDASGRVYVFFYDQGVAASGDRSEVSFVLSNDGGVTWSAPAPLTVRPFNAGHGNDTGQPNLGDYNEGVSYLNTLLAAYALPEPRGFSDGQPSAQITTPDATVTMASTPTIPVALGEISFTDSGGNGHLDAGDQVRLTIPLWNFVTNPLSATAMTGVRAVLQGTGDTPTGVVLRRSSVSYGDIAPGAVVSNVLTYVLQLSADFVPGAALDLALAVASEQGSATLAVSLPTGTPVMETLLSEDFEGVLPGRLPPGWTASHAGGSNIVPWTTTSTFCAASSNAAFHQNARDAANPVRFERLFSPLFQVPADAEYVLLEMDVCYDTEDDPSFNVLAYDGFTLRVTDHTPGQTLRSVLVEAFAEFIRTGSLFHFPKHLPRSSSSAYFENMSVWAGWSNGFEHVSMRLPGMAGRLAQLRFEYTQDSFGTCADVRPGHSCGVMVDNLVVRSVRSISNELLSLKLRPTSEPGVVRGVVTTQAVAPTGGMVVGLSSSLPGETTMPASVLVPGGTTQSEPFTVSTTAVNTVVVVTATGPSNARTATILVK